MSVAMIINIGNVVPQLYSLIFPDTNKYGDNHGERGANSCSNSSELEIKINDPPITVGTTFLNINEIKTNGDIDKNKIADPSIY